MNIQGHVVQLYLALVSPSLSEIWAAMALPHLTFGDVGLHPRTSDRDVWQLCQREQYLLITANRNNDGPDSLEATLRGQNTASSLPVLTLANANRVLNSATYAKRVAERLIEVLMDMDNYRGTGRVYLP
jgi:hypothetical protein